LIAIVIQLGEGQVAMSEGTNCDGDFEPGQRFRAQIVGNPFPPYVQEYLNFKGTKLSKSRGAFVEVPYFLSKYDPDALRFYRPSENDFDTQASGRVKLA
jgi:leucyl-tRNA synthetase